MKKILLIEDDTILRENTAELLELSNFEVRTASNGKLGVIAAKEYLPHVILCDIMMPELDGYGVLDALSKTEETRGIPFIFLSAKTEREDIRKGMEMGADDYLAKPFTESELIGAIKSRLAKMVILKDVEDKNSISGTISEKRIKSLQQFKNYIKDNGGEYSFQTRETIYCEGMHANIIYLILKGAVKIHKLDEKGKELITGIHRPDDFFGFSFFTKDIVHTEYATALEKTELVGISSQKLRQLLEGNDCLAIELMQFLSENLFEAKEQLLEMAYGSVRKKTARTILKFAEKLQKDSKGNLHILRSDLASVAGMATETLIRTLSGFKKEGLVQIEGRNVKILDMDKLSRVY
ncbi:response regulator [Pricia antarctica]|nr:response regulator [Pricia antarctica]